MVAKSKNLRLQDAFRFVGFGLPIGGVPIFLQQDNGFPETLFHGMPDESQDRVNNVLCDFVNQHWWLDESPSRDRDRERSIHNGRRFLGPDDIAIPRGDAARIFGVSWTSSDGAEQSGSADNALECDDPRWPEELGIAMTAWRAACNGVDGTGKRPGAFIRDWLTEHYPDLSSEAIKRIATVANWDKQAGAPKRE